MKSNVGKGNTVVSKIVPPLIQTPKPPAHADYEFAVRVAGQSGTQKDGMTVTSKKPK